MWEGEGEIEKEREARKMTQDIFEVQGKIKWCDMDKIKYGKNWLPNKLTELQLQDRRKREYSYKREEREKYQDPGLVKTKMEWPTF